MSALTLYEKLRRQHLVKQFDDGNELIYIDLHLIHEVTSPQAFAALRAAGRTPRQRLGCVATVDHAISTDTQERSLGSQGIRDPLSREQVTALEKNCQDYDIRYFGMADRRQGIVHVTAPEHGITLPGMTIVCGDSHTSTHGALATLAQGIGTSEIEHVLATQCLLQKPMDTMQIYLSGHLQAGATAKDLALALIGKITSTGGRGYAMEFAGPLCKEIDMAGRMTLCNMSIEAGARCGMFGFDEITLDYIRQRPMAPKGKLLEQALNSWQSLYSDKDARFDKVITIDASDIAPQVSWGTVPDMVGAIDDNIPNPADIADKDRRNGINYALEYMGLKGGQALAGIEIDRVFIGSCTNSRIEDLRMAAAVAKGHKIAPNIRQAMVVPGSFAVKCQAEEEGLDEIFRDAGMLWREPGCSMCLAMNADRIEAGERCASTANRNFEGRHGHGGRVHLMSPAMAAAAAIAGHFVDVRELL